MSVMLFLTAMHKRDEDKTHFECGGKHSAIIAQEVANTLRVTKKCVFKSYQEWRQGEAIRWGDAIEANSGTVPLGFGSFEQHKKGSYERSFLMDEEDLKIDFECWMQKNLRKLSVDLARDYLNTKLLCTVDERTLLLHRVSLPISRSTTRSWMEKYDAH